MLKKNIPLILIIFIQIIIFSAPHIFGVINQNDDYVFTGNFGPSNENNDTQCANCFYLTMGFKQSYDGAFIIEDKFQGYDTYPKIIHLWWIIGGHLSRILGMDVLTFNLLQRLLWIILSSIVVFKLSKKLFTKTSLAVYSLLFFSFSSYLIHFTPEGTVFIANTAAVVLPLAYLLLAALFLLIHKFINQRVSSILFSILILELAFSYPYAMITFTVSVSLFFIYLYLSKQRKLLELAKFYAIIFIPAFCVILYDFYLVYNDPRLVGSQAHVYSDSFKTLLIGYLPFTFFAFLFLFKLFLSQRATKEYKNFWIYIYIFTATSLLFTQIPTTYLEFSMQMIVGIQLPLILISIEYIRLYVAPKFKSILLPIILVVTIIPNINFYKVIFENMKHHHIPSYIDREIHQGLLWLDDNVSKQSQLLCLPRWSSYAGIFAGTRLYIGGDILFTPDYNNRLAKFEDALKSDSINSISEFLNEERIDYIFYDESMKLLDEHKYLLQVGAQTTYQNPHVQILKVD